MEIEDGVDRHHPSHTGTRQSRSNWVWSTCVVQMLLHATACARITGPSAKRTPRGGEWPVVRVPGWAGLFRSIVFGSDRAEFVDDKDRPEDGEDGFPLCRLSTGRSDCQSIPCCFLSCAKDSRRAARSSFDLTIFSGWWYRTMTHVRDRFPSREGNKKQRELAYQLDNGSGS